MEEGIALLDEAIALARLELQELAQNTEDSLVIADEYASKRYLIVNKAWEMQKEYGICDVFKEKIQVLYGLQKELLHVAEEIRETIANTIKNNGKSTRAIKGYKTSTTLHDASQLVSSKG